MNRRPDILGEFTADHRAVTELLDQVERAPAGSAERADLLTRLTDLLFTHCAAEEEHLFPLVQHDAPDGGALVFGSIHEHLAIGQYLSDLQGLAPADPAFDTLLRGLADTLRRHLADEEKRLFPAARKAVPAAARAALGDRLRAERAETADAGEAGTVGESGEAPKAAESAESAGSAESAEAGP
ncbi:iron-sulfur cluster repair protein YtfE (RIC family) [Kitasatospora sp. MAA19]|uniref:hemerythrin domain-containing protein n=1 Tax=Kitasatospora sp. MAA19 TaxID=3035090 RepID=UPI002473F326|nr:hemerythrin domain-containing protein [Kitasatospora sp. MAA19]MDH6703903.1 iron-sulfur cluster repair protein YtfE (RIC family) [Kitasatospora sp. MAA19]